MERLTEYTKEGQAIPRMDLRNNGHQKCTNRLAEYEDLEEQGKLWKLPCAVGDTVWDNDFGRPCSYEVTGFSFGNLNDGFDEEMELHEVLVHYTDSARCVSGRCPVSEIGKSVFLTKQAAEQALKGMEGQ